MGWNLLYIYNLKYFMSNKSNKLKAVDFFCGGGGMSYGMKEAGIQVLAGIDFEPNCKKTRLPTFFGIPNNQFGVGFPK